MPLRSDSENFALIRVIGVGGGGSNAVNRMIRAEMMGVEFIACNTDAQALLQADAPAQDPDRRQDHPRSRRRRRRGDRPARGGRGLPRRSAQALVDSDMVFITAGLGGGTGSGAAPVVAADRQGDRGAHHRRRDQAVLRSRAPSASSSPRRRPRSSSPRSTRSSRSRTTGSRTSSRRTPASSTRSASSTTSCARASRASATSSPCQDSSISISPTCARSCATPAPRSWASAGRPARTAPSRRPGMAIASPLLEVDIAGRPGHPVQHHRLVDPQPVRGDRGRRGDPRRRPTRRPTSSSGRASTSGSATRS